jgi:glucan phosphoethanolaminetransferase (alkaline phosphatase superfamily)
MDITLPVIPTGIITLLAFFSPYAVAVVSHPGWAPKYKRLIAIVVTLVLAAVSMLVYYMMTGYIFPHPAQFLLLFLIVSQAAYALILKPSAKALESSVGPRHRIEETHLLGR